MISHILRAWRGILVGRTPCLSIEITRECPLTCPGCYAYNEQHLGGDITLRQMSDLKGQALIDGILQAIRKYGPQQVSLIGGEPLVRYRELNELLPQIAAMGVHTQVVTSAVRQIPLEWRSIPNLQIAVSIDGLQPEHDVRRKPATYERILKHIQGHQITVHCTVTRQILSRENYLEQFTEFWSAIPDVKQIWFSLYTPQVGETSEERLTSEDRQTVVSQLLYLREKYSKLRMSKELIQVYSNPPQSPTDCIFARTTTCLSSDLKKHITPCQFGGTPDCKNCGCMASAGFEAIARHRLPGGLRVGTIFEASLRTGKAVNSLRSSGKND